MTGRASSTDSTAFKELKTRSQWLHDQTIKSQSPILEDLAEVDQKWVLAAFQIESKPKLYICQPRTRILGSNSLELVDSVGSTQDACSLLDRIFWTDRQKPTVWRLGCHFCSTLDIPTSQELTKHHQFALSQINEAYLIKVGGIQLLGPRKLASSGNLQKNQVSIEIQESNPTFIAKSRFCKFPCNGETRHITHWNKHFCRRAPYLDKLDDVLIVNLDMKDLHDPSGSYDSD